MTRFVTAVDDTLPGWETVLWTDRHVDERRDQVLLLTIAEFLGEPAPRAAARLDAARAKLLRGHPGLPVEIRLTGGPTADTLVFEGTGGDLLVIGGRQSDRVLAAVSGRIAERVVSHALTPVVVVPEEWGHTDRGPVVVGLDGTTSRAALGWAADFAVASGCELVLVSAWEVPAAVSAFAVSYLEEDRDIWRRESDLELEAALRAVRSGHPSLPVRTEALEGAPDAALLRASRGASIVVLGRRHRTALTRFLGSVGESLMHHTDVPVCIVPPPVDQPTVRRPRGQVDARTPVTS